MIALVCRKAWVSKRIIIALAVVGLCGLVLVLAARGPTIASAEQVQRRCSTTTGNPCVNRHLSIRETVFVRVPLPLTTVATGPKVWAKKIPAGPIRGHDDNIKRRQFNEMVRRECAGKGPILDLAVAEATYAEGTRAPV